MSKAPFSSGSDLSDAPIPVKASKSKHKESTKPTDDKPKGIYCHQCRGRCQAENSLRCTLLRSFSKKAPPRACNLAWCSNDLSKRYHIQADSVRSKGSPSGRLHEPSAAYEFTCPCCSGNCQSSQCHRHNNKNQPRKPSEKTAKAAPQTKSADPSSFFSDSDLSDPPEPPAKKAKPSQSTKPTKTKPKTSTKASSKEAKPKQPRKTPAKPKTPPVDPPVFERVDTRLSLADAEDRMGLREFVYRFRTVLSVPERNLPALDDFDRPLTEASVRLLAGSLLEVIKNDLHEDEDEIYDVVFNFREELRYYGDLARFATIFNTLKEQLGLKPPSTARKTQNEASVRALLDLAADEPTPTWAIEPATTRRGASKVPQPHEVVKMLLSLADYAIHTAALRTELESTVGESEARKQFAKSVKDANSIYETEKKRLAEQRVTCKTSAETKANKVKFDQAQRDHQMRLAQATVNLRSSQRPMRQEPLGVDLDGRIYYALSYRAIDDNIRPPIGWASGVLAWGTAALRSPEDDLPEGMERWSHFGTSASVKQLAKWLDWRTGRLKLSRPKPANGHAVSPRIRATSISGSELSSVPDDDLTLLVDPPGYEKSTEKQVEEAEELTRRLREVADWLEVLEWKGLGEL